MGFKTIKETPLPCQIVKCFQFTSQYYNVKTFFDVLISLSFSSDITGVRKLRRGRRERGRDRERERERERERGRESECV